MIPKLARVTMVLGAGMLTVAVLATAQAKDPFVGTWRLNLAKSTYSPGPPPKSTTSTYEAAGQGYKVSVKIEPASGPVQQWSYTSNLDGKDSPISGNNPNADTVAAKRHRREHARDSEQEGWQGHDDAKERGRGRRQDADRDDDGH